MKPFVWSPDKDDVLKASRGFGFAELVEAIDSGGLLDDLPNPSAKFEHQRMMIVALRGYAIVVPYVEETDYIFLKTAFPSRQATKRYLR